MSPGYQFRVNGSALGSEDTTAPYGVDWNTGTQPNGQYTITATARDLSGNLAQSSSIAVTVSNSGPAIPPSLVAAYALAEGSGGTTADTGPATAIPERWQRPVWTAAGKYGSALGFDGVNDLAHRGGCSACST